MLKPAFHWVCLLLTTLTKDRRWQDIDTSRPLVSLFERDIVVVEI